MKIRACINCGYCCTKSACAFGVYDNAKGKCINLAYDKDNNSYCLIYEDIVKNQFAKFNPAFGEGCCSSINTLRHAKMLYVYKGVEQYIDNSLKEVKPTNKTINR